ncbi:MAG: hypothetical protein PHH11_10230 [Methylomonas sp.]|nr:hypothetical protein [Methylomonas sp.]
MPLANRLCLCSGRLIGIFYLLGCIASAHATVSEFTADSVYAQALQIEKEVALLKRFTDNATVIAYTPVKADLKPSHIWQKAYEIQLKLSIFRHRQGLPGFSPVTREPELNVSLRATWGQMLRTQAEITSIKAYLGIQEMVTPAAPVQGKRLIDVFDKLNQISYELDSLNGEAIGPRYIYAQVIRFNEDVNAILHKTRTEDTAVPPPGKPDASIQDLLAATFSLLSDVQRLQRQLGIATTDFGEFRKTDKVASPDVFNLVILCLTELETIKAQLE